MARTMTKYQLDHFKSKVDRNFDHLIKEQELLVKQFRTEATKRIVGKLSKKMGADKILEDCEEQLRDWAKELVDREIRRRPEGLQLKQLEDVKQKAIDTVFESGTSEDLIKALDLCTKKIGITWIVDTSKIQQISA